MVSRGSWVFQIGKQEGVCTPPRVFLQKTVNAGVTGKRVERVKKSEKPALKRKGLVGASGPSHGSGRARVKKSESARKKTKRLRDAFFAGRRLRTKEECVREEWEAANAGCGDDLTHHGSTPFTECQ